MISVRVDKETFDLTVETGLLATFGVGGIASFTGRVREGEALVALTLEHYPAMTRAAIVRLAEEATGRWSLVGVSIVHRVGTLAAGEPIVFVGTASAHRTDALEACAFLIDRLKTDAPFWKREHFVDGTHRWIEQREADAVAADRWRSPPKG